MSDLRETIGAEAIRALEQNWRSEKENAGLYRELADAESDSDRRDVLRRLADAEERHALRWEKRLSELGFPLPALTLTWRERINHWLNARAGLAVAIRRMEVVEDRNHARYEQQQSQALANDAAAQNILQEIAREEKAHAKVLRNMSPQLGPKTALDAILRRERWHRRGFSWIADAIYGVNDGLGAVFGIVSGVAGATNNQPHYVLISGLAGMIASALSMGAGAYLAVKSEREVYEAEFARERREVEEDPEEEMEELALFYELQGLEPAQARKMAETVGKNPDQMLKAMAQQELGLSEGNFPNPWQSSATAAVSTAVGAFIPIVPFFFLGGFGAVAAAFVISILAHFAVGAAKSILTMRSWWFSGLEMTLVGVLEAAVTYGLGLALGAII